MRKKYRTCLLFLPLLSTVFPPASRKEYQKSRLNDLEMTLGNRKIEKEELNFQVDKGPSGANGGKTGGGCRLQLISSLLLPFTNEKSLA